MTTEIGFIPLVRRWWWLLVVCTVIAGVASNLLARFERPTYAASATLLVGPLSADYDVAQAAGDIGRTYAELAKTLPVLTAAVARTHESVDPTALQKRVGATSNDITRLVTLRVEASTPALAATLANGIGAQLIALSRSSRSNETDAIRTFMGQRPIATLSPSAQSAIHAAAVTLFGSGITGRLQMMAPAVPPTSPAAPKIPLLTTLGALAGLALAVVVALILSAAADRGRSEVESFGGVPLLGTVAEGVGSPSTAADYRVLAAKLALLDGRAATRTLVVMNGDSGEQSGIVAVNLSSALADEDTRILVVDAGGGPTRRLGLEARKGYGELVREPFRSASTVDELSVLQSPQLRVLPLGSNPPVGRLEKERARKLLALFEQAADLVVICVPSPDRSPAGLVWAGLTDATLLVGDDGNSPDGIQAAAYGLELVGARILGSLRVRHARGRRPWLREAQANAEATA